MISNYVNFCQPGLGANSMILFPFFLDAWFIQQLFGAKFYNIENFKWFYIIIYVLVLNILRKTILPCMFLDCVNFDIVFFKERVKVALNIFIYNMSRYGFLNENIRVSLRWLGAKLRCRDYQVCPRQSDFVLSGIPHKNSKCQDF